MKIVITGRNYSVADHGKSIRMLEEAGHEVVNCMDRNLGTGVDPKLVAEAVGDAEAAIIGLEPYNEEVFRRCPNLRMISRRGVGYDQVDLDACRKYGITATRTVGTVEDGVAEHVMAYILYFARRIDEQNTAMHNRQWKRIMMPGVKGRTLGLVGFGGIGKEIAKRAVPFGMKVLYNCRHPHPKWEQQYGVSYASLDELLHTSDYVSVNVPLTPETEGMFDEALFAKMKEGSIFINIARAKVMKQDALKHALKEGRLAAAAIDVYTSEPCSDWELAELDNCILTPHTAPYTETNFAVMDQMAAQNILDYEKGCIVPANLLV